MTLRHMKIFVSVFRHNNITKAAGELHLSQPSVSFAVKELEEYYGIRLFERIGRRISPTECGKEFYGYAVHIVSLFETMEHKIRNWELSGTIRIGASITIGTHILPHLIRLYQPAYPDLRIEVTVNQSAFIERCIVDNSIDIGLIESRTDHTDLISIPFMKDSLQVITPPDHPLLAFPSITLEQLSQYPLLMREKGSAGREILDASFSLCQVTVRPLWESSSTQAIVRGVAEGLGVAVLPDLLIQKDLNEGTVQTVPLAYPLHRDLHIIYHKSKYLTDNLNDFINLCQKHGNEIRSLY